MADTSPTVPTPKAPKARKAPKADKPTFAAFRRIMPLVVMAFNTKATTYNRSAAGIELGDECNAIERMPSYKGGDRLPSDCFIGGVDESEKPTLSEMLAAFRNVKSRTNAQLRSGFIKAAKAHAKADNAN